jgi:hypothetical protein
MWARSILDVTQYIQTTSSSSSTTLLRARETSVLRLESSSDLAIEFQWISLRLATSNSHLQGGSRALVPQRGMYGPVNAVGYEPRFCVQTRSGT